MPAGMPQMQGMMPGMQPMAMPGMGMPQMGMPAMNPMMQMMQMMQMMMGGGMPQMAVDPAAMPFAASPPVADDDAGLEADIIRPATLTDRVKTQHGLALGSVLDRLCLTEDGQHALGGVPRGCTMALAGPPGKGKTRTALAGLAKVALAGEKVAFVVAEEGFHDSTDSGRDDFEPRYVRLGGTWVRSPGKRGIALACAIPGSARK